MKFSIIIPTRNEEKFIGGACRKEANTLYYGE